MNREGLTLVEVLMFTVVVVTLAGHLLPNIGPGYVCDRVTACQNNLSQIYKLGAVYSSSHGGRWPAGKGEKLWLSFRHSSPPLIEEGHALLLACPVLNEDCGLEETHYRGPALPFGELGVADPLGADKVGNHGVKDGGNLLLKDGGVQTVDLNSLEWECCALKLSP
jgi:hypothetical protein